jgi:integrase
MRRFVLGSYSAIRISDARTAARGLREKVRDGADPTRDRRHEREIAEAAKAGAGTFAAILDLYGEKRGDAQKAWGEARKRINLIFKPLLKRPAETLVGRDFQVLADSYRSQSSASYAVRSLRPALKWAAQRSYVPEEVSRIHPPAPVSRRRRTLTRDELAALLPALRASKKPYGDALRFMLLTLTRRQEAALARWRGIDWQAGTLTIPETKNGEPHVLPLSRQAIALLRNRLPELGTPDPDTLIFSTRSGRPLGNWDRETGVLQEASGTKGWSRHDLRRTGATMLGEMGELPDIVEAALNHVSIRSPLAATYNRSRYRPQVATALQRLADALDGIEAGAAKVVPLRVGT